MPGVADPGPDPECSSGAGEQAFERGLLARADRLRPLGTERAEVPRWRVSRREVRCCGRAAVRPVASCCLRSYRRRLVAAGARPAETRVGLGRRQWGYVVWAVALGFVFIPEILAAIPLTESQLPFPTISRMTGHLEYEHAEWEIAPTMLSVFVLLSLLRVPPKQRSGGHRVERDGVGRNREQVGP